MKDLIKYFNSNKQDIIAELLFAIFVTPLMFGMLIAVLLMS